MNNDHQTAPDAEFQAMQIVFSALHSLDDSARLRVLQYVSDRLGITTPIRLKQREEQSLADMDEGAVDVSEEEKFAPKFETFAELYDATQPRSQPDKALVCGYWLQVCQGADTFDAFSVNKELKNLGEGVANITSALDALKTQKPALALQLKKSGKSRQARKTYKITVAGIRAVEAMTVNDE